MDNLLNLQQTMSSREIAELTGKNHQHVLRDCDTLNESYDKLGMSKIGQGYYTHPNTGSQQHREMLLTRMQTFDLMTGYSVELRIKVNRRWEELEKKNMLDFNNPDTVLMLAQNWKNEQMKRLQAENELRKAAPKVLFADSVTSADQTILVSGLAKILKQNGIETGEKRLYAWLRQNGYLCSKGKYYNQPTQKAMELGLFHVKEQTVNKPSGAIITFTTTVTGKGQVYFTNKFLSSSN